MSGNFSSLDISIFVVKVYEKVISVVEDDLVTGVEEYHLVTSVEEDYLVSGVDEHELVSCFD